MTPKEASALVSMMLAYYPNAKFEVVNAKAYEAEFLKLETSEAQAAVETLVQESKFLPTIAELRSEITRVKRAGGRASYEASLRLALPPAATGRSGPTPEQWGKTLSELLEQSARWRRMAEPWYRARVKPLPPDPTQPYIDLASAGARGEDVGDRVRRAAGLGEFEDDSERRYP